MMSVTLAVTFRTRHLLINLGVKERTGMLQIHVQVIIISISHAPSRKKNMTWYTLLSFH